jgi:hypothetical protein
MDAATGMIASAGVGAVGQILGMANSKNLMAEQKRNQMALNEHGHKLQKDMWDYTNYENQRKHMENAGLNVGMMYGGSGGGGTTAGGQSGGSATSGETPNTMGMMLQAQQIASQIELNKAQANKLNVDAEKTAGVDTEKGNQEIQNLITSEKGIALDNALKSGNMENVINLSEELVNNAKLQGEKSGIENSNLDKQMKAEIANKVVNTALQKMQTENVDQQTKASIAKVQQDWKELELKNRGLDIQEQQANIQKFGAETQRNYPSLMNVAGNVMNDGLKAIYRIFGMNKEESATTTKIK